MDFDRLSFFERQVSRPLQRSIRFAVSEAIDRYEGLYTGKIPTGLKTGFDYLDNLTGGLKPGNYVAIGAPSGAGKSTLALNIVNHVAVVQRLPVAFFSLEMSAGEVIDFLFSLNGQVNRNHFNTGKFESDELDRIAAFRNQLAGCALQIFDESSLSISDMREDIELMASNYPIALIVVDYAQLMGDGSRDNREQEVARISRGLKSLARDCGCPILVLSQLNEQGKMRESRSIFNDSNLVLILSESQEPNQLHVEIAKGRNCPKGSFNLYFEAEHCRLT